MAKRRRTARSSEPAAAASTSAADLGPDDTGPHLPVLARETVEMVDPQPGQTIVDGTFGAGGHAGMVAERLGPDGLLVVIDRDPVALEIAERFRAAVPCRVRVIAAPFADAFEQLAAEGFRADGAYLDLGMSSMQIDQAERGFAYTRDAPLDMRMGLGDGGSELTSAAELVASWDVETLQRTIGEYGEERYAGRIARAIVRERERQPIETTGQLVDVISRAVPTPARYAAGHPAKRTFQALRIAVNDELGQIDRALPAAWDVIDDGGRLAAISFHSLEDRRVKQFFAALTRGCVCPPELPVCVCGRTPEAETIGRKASVAPTQHEQDVNPRSRSARLRGVRRIGRST